MLEGVIIYYRVSHEVYSERVQGELFVLIEVEEHSGLHGAHSESQPVMVTGEGGLPEEGEELQVSVLVFGFVSLVIRICQNL